MPPPKEIVLLSPSRKRQLYAYASHPVVYNTGTLSLSNTYNNSTNSTQYNGNKSKATVEQNYNNRNTFTTAIAKDRYRYSTNNSRYDGNATAIDDGDGNGDGNVRANDEGSIEIVSKDKLLMATTNNSSASKISLPLNGVRGPYASPANVPGGLHITKQQFHQQLKQNRSKR